MSEAFSEVWKPHLDLFIGSVSPTHEGQPKPKALECKMMV